MDFARGEKHGRVKLTAEKVLLSRRLHREGKATCGELAARWRVSRTTMRFAIMGKTWAHLPMEGPDAKTLMAQALDAGWTVELVRNGTVELWRWTAPAHHCFRQSVGWAYNVPRRSVDPTITKAIREHMETWLAERPMAA